MYRLNALLIADQVGDKALFISVLVVFAFTKFIAKLQLVTALPLVF
jgi:hypothetical protein